MTGLPEAVIFVTIWPWSRTCTVECSCSEGVSHRSGAPPIAGVHQEPEVTELCPRSEQGIRARVVVTGSVNSPRHGMVVNQVWSLPRKTCQEPQQIWQETGPVGRVLYRSQVLPGDWARTRDMLTYSV